MGREVLPDFNAGCWGTADKMEIGEQWMATANNVHNESNINDHDQAAGKWAWES